MARPTAHLELMIEIDSEPISGLVSNGEHGAQPFNGWIELVAAIEAVRSSATRAGGSGAGGAETLGFDPGANASEL